MHQKRLGTTGLGFTAGLTNVLPTGTRSPASKDHASRPRACSRNTLAWCLHINEYQYKNNWR